MILAVAGSNPAAPATFGVDVNSDIVVLSGNSNIPLANKISKYIELPLGKSLVTQYCDGESRVEILENIRGKDVYIIQSLTQPINHHIMESLIIIDSCRILVT